MLATGFSFGGRGRSVVVGTFVVCTLLVSGLFWGESGVGGKVKVDPRSPVDSGSLAGLEMRRLDVSSRFARWNTYYCGSYSYDAAWLGYVGGRDVCMVYFADDNEFWLVKGDSFIPLTEDIILLSFKVGETSLIFFGCDEAVLRCSNPVVMPPMSGLDVSENEDLAIVSVVARSADVEPEGITQLRPRVSSLPSSSWFAKLCYVSDTLSYSDNCVDENAPPKNFAVRKIDLDARNNFTLSWYWDTASRGDPSSLESSLYLRDINAPEPAAVSCRISEAGLTTSHLGGYHHYTCTGHTLEFNGSFVILGSDTTAAKSGGTITPLPKPEIRVVAIEVTQGIQNWQNTVTLVKDRRTAVRVFMETTTLPRKITANLRGTILSRQGSRTIGVTPPVNHNLQVEVKPNIIERRGKIEASLNFLLPSVWTNINQNDQLNLELDFEEGSIDCQNKCSVTVALEELSNEPYLVMIPLSVMDDDQETKLSHSALREQFERIMSIMPLTNYFYFTLETVQRFGNDPYYGVYFGEYEPVSRDVHIEHYLKTISKWAKDSPSRYLYIGVLPGGISCTGDYENCALDDGLSEKYGRVAVWYSGYWPAKQTQINLGGYMRNIGSHELGHLFGSEHPIRVRENRNSNGYYVGECGEDSDAAEIYPHFYELTNPHNTEPRKEWLPALGQLYDSQLEVWGLDLRFVAPVKGRRFQGEDLDGMHYSDTDYSVINPYEVFSIMSYCNHYTNRPQNQGRWIDVYHHEKIINYLNGEDNAFSISSVLTNADLISGSINFSHNGDITNVKFDPVFYRHREIISTPEGSFILELRDAFDNVIRSISFDANENLATLEDTLNFDFSVIIPDPPEYDSFAIVRDGTEYSVATRSQNQPTVDVLGISSGRHFGRKDAIKLSWYGDDIDGDSLTYRVYFSNDAGVNYRPVMFDTDKSNATFPAQMFEGTRNARFGISVSDGTRSTFTETPIFTISGSEPQATIKSPSLNSRYAQDQAIVLDARGFDYEDASLTPSAFTWHSNIDGYLGVGDLLILRASDLSTGEHTITLTVTDSDNMVSIVSTEITVFTQNSSPVAVDDAISLEINEITQIDVLTNDIDLEGDIYVGSLSLKTLPKLGAAQIIFSSTGHPVVSYSSVIDGFDIFTYEVCDRGGRCDTATIKVDVIVPDCTITGTGGDDILEGTSGDDVICGLEGNDTIDARSGNDKIYGGSGNDILYGRSGDDYILGGDGNDNILGHNGDDEIIGSLGDDIIYAGGGNDIIKGGNGNDELFGEAGNDTIEAGNGNDKIHGGRGDDTIRVGKGNDIIRGNAGSDLIYPGSGDDTILGLSSEDRVF